MMYALLGGAAYVAYEWYKGQSAAAPAATAVPVAATPVAATPVTTATGAYTTALTSQPATPVVAAPVTTAVPPATTPVQTSIGTGAGNNTLATPGGCDSQYSTMVAALLSLSAGDQARDASNNIVAGAAAGTLNGWQWDWYVTQKMGGTGTPFTYAEADQPMDVCAYMALRAKYSMPTGLSGLARMNVPLVWRFRHA
jgi:hypothetical protein